jgi:hypothetical protein
MSSKGRLSGVGSHVRLDCSRWRTTVVVIASVEKRSTSSATSNALAVDQDSGNTKALWCPDDQPYPPCGSPTASRVRRVIERWRLG